MDYSLSKVTSVEDKAKAEDFIYEHFFSQMPLFQLFGIQNRPPPRSPPTENTEECRDFILKAVDSRGDIIGVAINKSHVVRRSNDTDPEVMKMVEFMDYIGEYARLDQLPKETIELRVLSVRPDWRQHGIARRLAEESVTLAREVGFTTMKMCCANEFTARLARSMGWREHYRFAYKDYPHLTLKPTPPQEYIYYYVTDL